jgi:hypothetical protein
MSFLHLLCNTSRRRSDVTEHDQENGTTNWMASCLRHPDPHGADV